jgi:hypothetical protein
VSELTARASYEVQGKTQDFQDAFVGEVRAVPNVTLPDNVCGKRRREINW